MSAPNSVVKINAITVPPQAGPELEKRFAARAHTVDGADGFLGFQLLRPVAGDEESFAAWRDGDARAAHAGPAGAEGEQRKPVSSGADLLEFEVVLDVKPS
jgi:heme-degrading monooxygenase HmoA